MRVLIAGGSGFIGRNFLLKAEPNWQCYATYNKSFQQLTNTIRKYQLKNVNPLYLPPSDDLALPKQFDLCLYAMGNSDIGYSVKSPLGDMTSNTNTLVNLVSQVEIKRLVFLSSGSVYEGYSGLVEPSLPLYPTIPYSVSKLASERYLDHFCRKGNIGSYISLRFFGAYGPMELTRKIYTKLIETFVLKGESSFTLNGNGQNQIDAMYIDDATTGIKKVLLTDSASGNMDFCYGQPMSLNELVTRTAKIFNVQNFNLQHQGDTPEYTTFHASPKAMYDLFGFQPKITLEEGMMRFKEFLCQH